jgi:Tol biopolymer transport system component
LHDVNDELITCDRNGTSYYAKERSWSPDGTRIVFVMYAGANDNQVDLFTVDPDGSDLTQMTDTVEVEYVPSWGTHPLAS